MNEATNDNKMHYVVALLLGVVGLLIIVVFINLRSNADQTDQSGTASTTISNYVPVLGSLDVMAGAAGSIVGSSVAPDVGPSNVTTDTETNLTVLVPYTDNNTCNQVASRGSFYVRLHKVGATCGAGDTNYNDCYEEDSLAGTFTCTDSCEGEADTGAQISCTFPVRHFTSPGSWVVDAGVTDEDTDSDTTASDAGFTLSSVKGIGLVDTLLNFGTMAVGDTTADDSIYTRVRNVGNTTAALSVYGTAFTCSKTISAFPVGQLKYATAAATAYGSQTALTTDSALVGTTLAKQTANTTVTEDANLETVYWKLNVPTGAAGQCTSTITVVGS